MVFVPHVIYHARTQEISPRAEELARRIAEAVEGYRASHPDLTATELQQAFLKASSEARPGASGSGANRAAVLASVLGALVAVGLMLFLLGRGPSDGEPWPALAVMVGVIALAAVFIVVRRSSS